MVRDVEPGVPLGNLLRELSDRPGDGDHVLFNFSDLTCQGLLNSINVSLYGDDNTYPGTLEKSNLVLSLYQLGCFALENSFGSMIGVTSTPNDTARVFFSQYFLHYK